MSVWKAAALAVAQLGVAAFFIAGVTRTELGPSAPWFVLAATILAAFVRTIDVESWALLIPGGFISRVASAFGPTRHRPGEGGGSGRARAARRARLCRHRTLRGQRLGHRHCRVAIHGLRQAGGFRDGRGHRHDRRAVAADSSRPRHRARDAGAGGLGGRSHCGVRASCRVRPASCVMARPCPLSSLSRPSPRSRDGCLWTAVSRSSLGFALALPVVGGGEVLSRAAHELPPPRVQGLRRTGQLTVLFAGIAAALGAFLVALLIPASDHALWANAPLAGLAQHLAAPSARARADGRRAGRCRRADAGSGRARRDGRCRADAASVFDRRDAAIRPRVPSYTVRDSCARGRRSRRGHDGRGAREQRAGGLALARLRHRDRRHAPLDGGLARPPPAPCAGGR